MAERFNRVFTLPSNLYATESPVIIAAGALLLDTHTNSIVAQLKFFSMSEKEIKALTVKLMPKDTAGRPLGEPVEYSYLDLTVKRDVWFGSKVPIKLPNNTTREFSVEVSEIVFDDSSVWTGSGEAWEQIPKQIELKSIYNSHVLDGFRMKFGTLAIYKHLAYKDLFFCTCGAANHASDSKCHYCKVPVNLLMSFDYSEYLYQMDYELAVSISKEERIDRVKQAINMFENLSKWKDCSKEIAFCDSEIQRLERAEEEKRIYKEKEEEIARKEAERIAKRNRKIANITTPIVCAIIIFIIVLNTVIIPNGKYNDAIALMDTGKYAEAIVDFEALDGYKDSVSRIEECNTAILDGKYNDAITLMNLAKYAEAISVFETLDLYKDSATKIAECNTAILERKYNDAKKLIDAGNIIYAYEALIELDGYKDSADIANSIYFKYRVERLKVAKVGEHVLFGSYEQDNNSSNGRENIEWLVLEIKNNRVLLVSKYVLDSMRFNTGKSDITWGNSAPRKWLNNEFINSAFSVYEKAMIPTVTVSAEKNPKYDTKPGNATQDKVFLLSVTEVKKYFSTDEARQCKPTNYANKHGAYTVTSDACCDWWLRSPGKFQNGAAQVSDYGTFDGTYDYGCYDSNDGIRPAMWIDLSGGM